MSGPGMGMIRAHAVEAAAKAIWELDLEPGQKQYEDCREGTKRNLRREATAMLEAAAPYMRDNRGDGDYLPGWDDRKTLAHIWQEYAPLPDEGLSDGVNAALIAVATWGYEQRKDEAL